MSPPTRTRPRPRRWVVALGVVALAAGAPWLDCAREGSVPRLKNPRGRVLILGIDGTDPVLLQQWMGEGHLPHLQALADAGSWGRIRGDFPILSPRVWTSVATGKTPEQHGIEGWVWTGPDGESRLFGSGYRRGAALWNILSAAGIRVATVNWLVTHPPEKVDGVIVSDLAMPGRDARAQVMGRRFGWDGDTPEDFAVAATWPPEWTARVAGIAKAAERYSEVETKRSPFAPGVRAEDELAARVALAVEAEIRPGLLMVLLQGNDRMSHYHWWGIDDLPERLAARPAPAQRTKSAEALRAHYRFTDLLVGKLLERFDDDDLILILSDHGFEAKIDPDDPAITGGHDTAEARNGVLFVRGPGIAAGRRLDTVDAQDVTPTVLAWLGLPVGRDMAGHVMACVNSAVPDTIETWDVVPIERSDVKTDELDATILQELKALGYVD